MGDKPEIIVALISLVGTIIAVWASARATQNKITNNLQTQNEVQNTKIEQLSTEVNTIRSELKERVESQSILFNTRLEGLTNEVRRHNGFAERLPRVESKLEVLDEKISVANNRISDLESLNK